MRGHFEEVVDNVALNRILQSIKVQNRLALVLNQRIALAVTAQTDGRAQIAHHGEMLNPQVIV